MTVKFECHKDFFKMKEVRGMIEVEASFVDHNSFSEDRGLEDRIKSIDKKTLINILKDIYSPEELIYVDIDVNTSHEWV